MIDAIDGKNTDTDLLIQVNKLKKLLGDNLVVGYLRKQMDVPEELEKDANERDTLIAFAIFSHLTRNHKLEFVKFFEKMTVNIEGAYEDFFEMPKELKKRLFYAPKSD